MGGKKTPQLPALGEGQKQETDPGAFLAHRIQAGLSREHLHWEQAKQLLRGFTVTLFPQAPGMLPHSQSATTAQVDKAVSFRGNF